MKHFLCLNITDKKLIFDGESGQKLFVDIDSSHINKIIEMSDVHDLLECYNRTIINSNKIHLIWNASYALLMNDRLGKSIFNTNLTFTCTQHISDYLEPGAKNLLISVDENYVAHFRNNFKTFFINQKLTFSNFLLDVELYQFFAYLNTI